MPGLKLCAMLQEMVLVDYGVSMLNSSYVGRIVYTIWSEYE